MKSWMLPAFLSVMMHPALAAEPISAEALAARGLQEGSRFTGLASICDLGQPLQVAGRRERPAGEGEARARPPARSTGAEAAPPLQVFDNLYFVGTRGASAWVLRTSEGLILIDALNNDEEAETYIEGGLRQLGLDPADIKYLVITHAHGDHYGGQNRIVSRYHPRVVMSAADWDELEKPVQQFSNPRWGAPPKRDLSVQDGDKLVLGDTTLQLQVTPGHTPGTLSLILPLRDGQALHHAALWGGTGLNFGPDEQRLRQYSDSAARFREIAQARGVDVFLSNHPTRDGSLQSMAALRQRAPGAPHPFVAGDEALAAFSLLRDCSLAQALRVAGNPPRP